MTTLLHLTQAIVDIQEGLLREQRFSQDACHNLLTGTKLLREGLDALERDIRAQFDERDRSVSRLLGNSQPYATVIDETQPQPAIATAEAAPVKEKRSKAEAPE